MQSARRYNGWQAYGRSKLANILFTRELGRRLDGTGVTASCFHPGAVATRFGSASGGLTTLLFPLARPFFRSAEQGADTLVYLASSPDVAKATGEYFANRKVGKPLRRRGMTRRPTSHGRRARRWRGYKGARSTTA